MKNLKNMTTNNSETMEASENITLSLTLSLTYIMEDLESLDHRNGGCTSILAELKSRFNAYATDNTTLESKALKDLNITATDVFNNLSDFVNPMLVSALVSQAGVSYGYSLARLDTDGYTAYDCKQKSDSIARTIRHFNYISTQKILNN